MAGAFILVMIVFPPTFIFNGAISQGLWKYGLGLGIFSIVVPSIAFTIGIPKIGSGLATILGAAELPVTTILSVLVLKEAVLSSQWFGVSLILIGIAIPQIACSQCVGVIENSILIKKLQHKTREDFHLRILSFIIVN